MGHLAVKALIYSFVAFQPKVIREIQAKWPWYHVFSFRNSSVAETFDPFIFHDYKRNPLAVRDVGEFLSSE